MPDVKLDGLRCTRCGHEWFPRSGQKPRNCPKCNSPYWDKEKKIKLKQGDRNEDN